MDWLIGLFIGAFSFYMVFESVDKALSKTGVMLTGYVLATGIFIIVTVFAFLSVFSF